MPTKLPCRVAAPVNYMLRVEREWSIMMEGGWAGDTSHQHRKQWADKVNFTIKCKLGHHLQDLGMFVANKQSCSSTSITIVGAGC